MISVGYTISAAKGMFFDRPAVKRMMDRRTHKFLNTFGRYVRVRARSSIRRRKGPSLPGRPPHTHTGSLRRTILYSFDPTRRSVVIGPRKLRSGGDDVLSALEYGGTVRQRIGRKRQSYKHALAARPFMGPAEAKELSNLPEIWRRSIV